MQPFTVCAAAPLGAELMEMHMHWAAQSLNVEQCMHVHVLSYPTLLLACSSRLPREQLLWLVLQML
jgi:hypothetical protein